MTDPTPAAQEARDTALVTALLDLWEDTTGGLPDHREAWDYLLKCTREEEERRKAEPRIPPWERPKRAIEKPKRFLVGRFIAAPPATPWDDPTTIERYEEYDPETGAYWRCDFPAAAHTDDTNEGPQNGGDDLHRACQVFVGRCASWRRRGRPVVLLSAVSGFNLLLLHLAPTLTQMGYRLRVVAARDGVCLLSLQRGHQSFPFWSLERCTGIGDWRRYLSGKEGARYATRAVRAAADRARGYQTLPGSTTTLAATAAGPAKMDGGSGTGRSRSRMGASGAGAAGTPRGRTGGPEAGRVGMAGADPAGARPTDPAAGRELRVVSAWLTEVQEWGLARFGVSLHATVAGAALGAASRRLPGGPDGIRFWRPPALLDSLCRTGGGYRGGWVYARRHRASVSKPIVAVDVRRLYTWCLSQPLPLAAGLALANPDPAGDIAQERQGLWLCSVVNEIRLTGEHRTVMPVSLAVWVGGTVGFQKQLWRGKECVCLLSSGEIPGLRALGYAVYPGIGYWYTQTFDLKSYVAAFQAVIDECGAESWQGALVKQWGNCLSGKWGAKQSVLDVCYSERVPTSTPTENAHGEYWYPMLDQNGVEVEGCWERRKRWVCPSQQPQLAAAVTAHGRGKAYSAAAALRASGGEVYYVDTDGLLTSADPAKAGLDLSGENVIGAWRVGKWDATAEIAAPRVYAHGGDVIFAGTNAPELERRAAVALLVDGRGAELAVRVVRRPWSTQEGGRQERVFHPPELPVDSG